MKTKNGKFTKNVQNIAKLIDRPDTQIYDYVSGRARAGRKMALALEGACKALSLQCPKEVWVWGSPEEIRSAINN